MAALPAWLRPLALVPRPPGRLAGAPAQGHDRGPGAKAPDRALAIHSGRRRAARDGAEAGLTGDADRASRDAYEPAEHRRTQIDRSGQTRWARLARWGRGSGGRDETWAA